MLEEGGDPDSPRIYGEALSQGTGPGDDLILGGKRARSRQYLPSAKHQQGVHGLLMRLQQQTRSSRLGTGSGLGHSGVADLIVTVMVKITAKTTLHR